MPNSQTAKQPNSQTAKQPNSHSIASWCSYRTYLNDTDKSKTLISNEKNHEYLLLENESSDLWFFLSQNKSFANLLNYAATRNIDEESLISFLDELSEAELLVSNNFQNNSLTAEPLSAPTQDKNTPDAQLEYEISEWAYSQGFLFSAHWEITYRCNEICVHCFNPGAAHTSDEKPNRNRDELTTKESFALIDDLVKSGVFRLTISGGEATLRKDFFEIVSYARSRGLSVVLYTNGLRLTEDFIQKLKTLWLHAVEISIYSSNPEIHDSITNVKGSFQKSIDALSMLKNSNIKAVMKSVQMQHTVHGYQLTRELGEKLNINVVIDSLLSPALDGKKAPLNHELPFTEMVALAATAGSPLFVGNEQNNWDKKDVQKILDKPVCGAGRKTLSIDPEGQISPCVAFPVHIGNVREKGFYPAWQHSQLQKQTSELNSDSLKKVSTDNFLSAWQSITLKSFDECGTHERCAWCNGLCPGDALLYSDNPLAAAENHCRESSARMTAAKMLMNGLNQQEIYAQLGVSTDLGRQYESRAKPTYPHFRLQPSS